jgi:cytochrome P450 family 110
VSQYPNPVDAAPWRHLIGWISDPIGFQAKYFSIYGDVFTIQLAGLGNCVVIGDPKLIQAIFSQDPMQFDAGRANAIAAPIVGHNSLALMDGDRHKRERKLLLPPFHGERLQIYADQICAITNQVVSQWSVNRPFVVRAAMQDISLEVILQVVFGLRGGERYCKIKPLLTAMTNATDSPLRSSVLFLSFLQHDWGAWSPWGQLKRNRQQICNLLQAEIDERRVQSINSQTDILSLLMTARDDQGQLLTDEELIDELLTILFAGHETTATTLAWSFYELLKHSVILEKLLYELDSLGDHPQLMQLAQLPYLTAVCQETLRKYPVLPGVFPRITKVPIAIAGYQFDANTPLMPSIYLVHHREDLYPNPHRFNPERFLERQYSPSEYFPFGGGNRRCLGYALAQLEMKLVLATVLSQCELRLLDSRPVKIQRRGLTLSPAGGVRVVMTGRRSSPKSSA